MLIPLDLLPLFSVTIAAAFFSVRAGCAAFRREHVRPAGPSQDGWRAGVQEVPYAASFGSRLLDIEREALGAIRQVDSFATRRRVRLEIAIQPGLSVQADPRGFHRALVCLLENAIGHAPGGKVLVGGMRHGGRIQIAVLDDGQGPNRLEQAADLRSVEGIVALHGGTLQIESRPGQGTLVVLRLPEPISASPDKSAPPAAATRPASSERTRQPAAEA